MKSKELTPQQQEQFLTVLEKRFKENTSRHKGISWDKVVERLEAKPAKLVSLFQMEETGGEPDVVAHDAKSGEFVFMDCSAESPKSRRSLCYDREAWTARKEFKPKDTALDMAEAMGIEILDEEQYRFLQTLGEFDLKTSSWLLTPASIRKLGGAIFGDRRYDTVFVFHNGADSYYAVRGFRASLRI